jgi:predicted phosphodiesterase
MATRTALIIPDLQVPLHDSEYVSKLIDVAEYVSPDILLFIGDLTDSTEVSRWVKGRPGEFTGNLQDAFDQTKSIVQRFRAAVGEDCEVILQDSNHDERTRKYVEQYAPALSSLRSLDLESLLGLDRAKVSLVHGVHEFLPGVVSFHGHERAYTSIPGRWGLLRVVEHGKHIVYGHTHTPGLFVTAQGIGEDRKNLWAMNVGHGMDMKKAEYLQDGYATWAQGFGVITHDGVNAMPELVVAMDGKFQFDGRIW